MAEPTSINPRIVEALYCDALVLSDEVRGAFSLSAREPGESDGDGDLVRIAISSEGLRTTTRMMHAVAWLLNLRAYFMGELSETQLRRHSRLSTDLLGSDPEHASMLEPEVRSLISETQRFYQRLLRLDRGWRHRNPGLPDLVGRLHETFDRSAKL
jgi:regulator of CtrA degradation